MLLPILLKRAPSRTNVVLTAIPAPATSSPRVTETDVARWAEDNTPRVTE